MNTNGFDSDANSCQTSGERRLRASSGRSSVLMKRQASGEGVLQVLPFEGSVAGAKSGGDSSAAEAAAEWPSDGPAESDHNASRKMHTPTKQVLLQTVRRKEEGIEADWRERPASASSRSLADSPSNSLQSLNESGVYQQVKAEAVRKSSATERTSAPPREARGGSGRPSLQQTERQQQQQQQGAVSSPDGAKNCDGKTLKEQRNHSNSGGGSSSQKLDKLVSRLSTKLDNAAGPGRTRPQRVPRQNRPPRSAPDEANGDPYYLSHGATRPESVEVAPPCQPVDNYYVSHSDAGTGGESSLLGGEGRVAASAEGSHSATDSESDSGSGPSEDEGGGERKAPLELLGEFMECAMNEEYETALKLCQMVLLYEPENKECKEFQPLLEEMLKRERHHQLWGSESEGSDDDDDDDDGSGEDSDSDEDSDEDGSDSSSGNESSDGSPDNTEVDQNGKFVD